MSAAQTLNAAPKPRSTHTTRTHSLTLITPSVEPTPKAAAVMQRQRDEALARGDLLGMLRAEALATPLLSRAEERALARRWRATGDTAARDELVTRNIQLVEWWAARYAAHAPHDQAYREDLAGAGMFGLMRAARDYDPERGWRFITYASWWIRQAMTSHCHDHDTTIRLPANQRRRKLAIRRITERFLQEEAREPSDAELLALLNASEPARPASPRGLRDLRMGGARTISLDQPPNASRRPRRPLRTRTPHEREADTEHYFVADPQAEAELVAAEDADVGNQLMLTLTAMLEDGRISAREVCVLARRYALGERLHQIGAYLGVTRERARQLQMSALAKLRDEFARQGVGDWDAWISGASGGSSGGRGVQ